MIDSNILNYSCLEPLNVSRETFPDLEEFRQIIINKNNIINLISKRSEQNSKERHIIDSAQIIDLIDINNKICTDIGSGDANGLAGPIPAVAIGENWPSLSNAHGSESISNPHQRCGNSDSPFPKILFSTAGPRILKWVEEGY